MAAELQVGVDPIFGCVQPRLLEPIDLVLRERLGRKLDERRPAPTFECIAKPGRPLACTSSARLGDEAFETGEIELLRFGVEHVTGGKPADHVWSEDRTQTVHLVLQRRARRRGCVLTPQLVDQLALRDRLVRPKQHETEERALLGRRYGHELSLSPNLERAEHAEVERRHFE